MTQHEQTLVLRLASPMQAWPAHSRGIRRPTYNAPTYSGLSGLARAALGIGRSDMTDPLAEANVIVRVDRTPKIMTDFHTVNTLPDPTDRFTLLRDRSAQMLKMSGGPYNETVVTYRQYVCDGAFMCFVTGPAMQRLADALKTPVWPLYFGRKACPPGPDLVLGLFDGAGSDLLSQVPVVVSQNKDEEEEEAQVSRQVHWLYETEEAGATAETWIDQPAGPVGAAYRARQRVVAQRTFSTVASSADLREWALTHAKQPAGMSVRKEGEAQ